MTWLHFLNCSLLTYAPFGVVYKSSRLSDYQSLKLALWACAGYVATQLLKLFLLATFVPASGDDEAAGGGGATAIEFSVLVEFMKALVSVTEMVGMTLTLRYGQKFEPKMRVLAAALGWAFADAVLSKLLPLFISARQAEFSWENVQMALASNVSMLWFWALAGYTFLLQRRTQSASMRTSVLVALAVMLLAPALRSFLKHALGTSEWLVLAYDAVVSLALVLRYRQLESIALK
jgi:BOS complex subunit TMEM147